MVDQAFSDTLSGIIGSQRRAYDREGPPSAAARIDRLNRVERLLLDNRDEIARTISSDFGHRSRHVTLIADIFATVSGLRFAAARLDEWMRPEPRAAMAPGAEARVEYAPKGVCGIIGTWNFPFNLVLAPLTGVLAAGNRAVLKPSELAPRSAELMARLVGEAFDPEEVAVVLGGPEEAAAFSAAPFDHLVFTGSIPVGSRIMAAAAPNLTPLTLELGGKNPAILTRSDDFAEPARRVMSIKLFNAGQFCLETDHVLVPRGSERAFADACVEATRELLPHGVHSDDYTSIVSDRHFARLEAAVEDARGKGASVIEAFPGGSDAGPRLMSPTFLTGVTDAMTVMQDEIFGPVLPIQGYDGVDDLLAILGRRSSPLALYCFGEDQALVRRLLDATRSGGVTVNDVATHAFDDDLPFGSVGASGHGAYHGRSGFTAFSHERAVYVQSPAPEAAALFRPPYGTAVRVFLDQAFLSP